MATTENRAAATVLQFPERNKGRKRHSNSAWSCGRAAMIALERNGGKIAPSVTSIRPNCRAPFETRRNEIPTRTPELAFALAIFGALTSEQQRTVRMVLVTMQERTAELRMDDRSAELVLNMLRLGRGGQ